MSMEIVRIVRESVKGTLSYVLNYRKGMRLSGPILAIIIDVKLRILDAY
jgi:hypothetical protein